MALSNIVITATVDNDRESSSFLSHHRPPSSTSDYHHLHYNSEVDGADDGGPPQDHGDIVIINVAGKRFQTFRSTLEQYPNTLMGNTVLFKKYFNTKTQEYFLDRNQISFPSILHFYQSGGVVYLPGTLPRDIHYQELDFYRIPYRSSEAPDGVGPGEEATAPRDVQSTFQRIRWRVWEFLERPDSSMYSRVWALLDVAIILLSILTVILESSPKLNTEPNVKIFSIIDTICVAFFTFDFLIRLMICPSLVQFVKTPLNILDCLAILPFYLELALGRLMEGSALTTFKVLRIFRIMRVMKLIRHSKRLILMGRVIQDCLSELTLLLIIWLMGVLTFGTVMYYIEGETNDGFDSILHSCWWAVVSISTVGYGDLVPITGLGKIVGSCLLFISMVYLALPMTVIVSKFNKAFERFREDEEVEQEKKDQKRLRDLQKQRQKLRDKSDLA